MAHGLGQNGGQAHLVNGPDGFTGHAEALKGQPNLMVGGSVQSQGYCCPHPLADDGSGGSAFNAQVASEDQNGVENDIGNRADNQGDHAQKGVAHGLKQPLAQGLQENPQAEQGADPKVAFAHGQGILAAAAQTDVGFQKEAAEKHKDRGAD